MRKTALLVVSLLLGYSTVMAATLRGRVIDEQGRAVPNLQLSVLDIRTQKDLIVTTDFEGRFGLTLPGGEYTINSRRSGIKTPLLRVRVGGDGERDVLVRVAAHGGTTVPADVPPRGGLRSSNSSDESLVGIRDYHVQAADSDPGGGAETRELAKLVNPFPTQKAGRFNGSLYEFLRNDGFDARNFFDPVGSPLPAYRRNQFGLNLGVVLRRNLNILGTYEGLRINQGSTLLSHLPTAAMKEGDFGALPIALKDPISGLALDGNQIPQSRIHPIARKLLSLFPDPNRADPDRNYVNNRPIVLNRDFTSFRVDYQFKDGSGFYIYYALGQGIQSLVRPLPSFGINREDRGQNVVISVNGKINNRMLANWRVLFDRSRVFLGSPNSGRVGLMESLGIPGLGPLDASEEGYPGFSISGYASLGDAGLPQNNTNNIFTFDGSLTITPENHTLQLGAGLQSSQSNDNRTDGLRKGSFSFDGYYSGDAFADFLFGVPDAAYRGVGSDRSDLRRKSWYVFAHDQWKLDPRLSLSWGLSYNLTPPFHSVSDNVSGFCPLLFEPPLNGEIVVAGGERARQLGLERAGRGSMIFTDRDDWSPSVGLAYRPLGSNRMTIRSSYSLYYSPLGRDSYINYLGRNYPFFYTESALSPQDKASLVLSNPFGASAVTELGVRGIESNIPTPTVHNWHLGMQNEIHQKWVLGVSYDGSKGNHLSRVMVANVPLPGPGPIQPRRPNPDFGSFKILTGGGSYSRSALNASLERRLADGVSLKSGFTWMSSIGDIYYGNPSNPRDLRAERSASDYIPARQFYLNYILDLPFGRNGRLGTKAGRWMDGIIGGWRLSGITRFQDGYRFTVTSAGDPNNDGVSDDRPDRIGSGHIDSARRTIDAWFATGDFVAPAPYSFGNSGRNILGGPPYANWDLSVIKQTRVFDSSQIEFRVELFNAFNQVNFDLPSSVFGTSVFGKIFGAKRAREIELALRYSF